jgi:hypothetical protein
MGSSIIQRAFSSGELAPTLAARADLARYLAGLRTCRNFVVLEHGGAGNRPGTAFVDEVKTSSARTYLVPCVFSDALAFVIEVGDTYFRFVKDGAPVETAPGTSYELATPYVTADLDALVWEQNGDVLSITHPSYAPRELRRIADTNWTLTAITTQPSIAAPTGLTSGGTIAGPQHLAYVITSVKAETYEESLQSGTIDLPNVSDPTPSDPIAVGWDAVAGAVEYRVFKDAYGNGVFGYIGTSTGLFFNDPGLLPDFTQTPPLARVLFNAAGDYPATVGYYQQRRIFASSNNNPEHVWASRIGFHSNFSVRSPLQDDDAVTFRLASREAQDVRWLIDLKRLLVITGRGEWKIQGDGEGGALIPTAINPDRQGYTGAAFVRPQILGQTVLFVQGRGTRVRDLSFDQNVGGIGSRDLTVYARHLFKRKTIDRMALAQTPDAVLWCVRSDGTLLGLTYLPEADVLAWHRHDTGDGDLFEDVAVIPEGSEDAVYVLVKRTVNGATKRYIERFQSREIESVSADAWFVDSGLEYVGAATTTVSGLDHLVGRTVKVLADGVVPEGEFVVGIGGTVTIPTAAARIVVGIGIEADLETLDLDVSGTELRDKRKRVANVTVLVEGSRRGFYVGPNADKLSLTRPELWESSATIDGAVESRISTDWSSSGRLFVRHTDPTPLTVIGIIPNVTVGG